MKLEFKGDCLNVNLIDIGEGEAVVVLHGWGARADLYYPVINPLSSSYRVIAPDFPGFGKTDEPSFPYSIEDYALFVEALLKELGITKAHLIGHSHGGRCVLELATGNYGFEIGKLVLIDSAGIPAKRTAKQKIKTKTYKLLKKIVLTKPVKKAFPNALDKLQKKFGSADYASSSPVLRQSMVKVLPCDYREKMPYIKNPTLLIWGEKDTATPLCNGLEMEKLIPDGGLVKIEGAGHFSYAEAPVITERVLKSFFKIQ